jgi:hypothetical protein
MHNFMGASTSDTEVDCYVVTRKLLKYVFNMRQNSQLPTQDLREHFSSAGLLTEDMTWLS